jgi:SnoaL-like domain
VTNISTTIDTLFAMWNEQDTARRTKLVETVWAEDGQLVDPPLEGTGHRGIADMVAAVQSQFPGHSFRRTTGIDAHHDTLRYGWELVGPDGAVVATGLDVGVVGDDGRLRRVNGFLGPLPEEASA